MVTSHIQNWEPASTLASWPTPNKFLYSKNLWNCNSYSSFFCLLGQQETFVLPKLNSRLLLASAALVSLRSHSPEPLVPMTPRPYIRNLLPKSFHWPLFYPFTEGKCYKRLIPPKKEFIPGNDSQLPVRADRKHYASQKNPSLVNWTDASLFCPWYSIHSWAAALTDKATPLGIGSFHFASLFLPQQFKEGTCYWATDTISCPPCRNLLVLWSYWFLRAFPLCTSILEFLDNAQNTTTR